MATATAVNAAATPLASAASPANIDAVFGALLQQMSADTTAPAVAAPFTGTNMPTLASSTLLSAATPSADVPVAADATNLLGLFQPAAGNTTGAAPMPADPTMIAAAGTTTGTPTSTATSAGDGTLDLTALMQMAASATPNVINPPPISAAKTDDTSDTPASSQPVQDSTDKPETTDASAPDATNPMLALFAPQWMPQAAPVATAPASNLSIANVTASDAATAPAGNGFTAPAAGAAASQPGPQSADEQQSGIDPTAQQDAQQNGAPLPTAGQPASAEPKAQQTGASQADKSAGQTAALNAAAAMVAANTPAAAKAAPAAKTENKADAKGDVKADVKANRDADVKADTSADAKAVPVVKSAVKAKAGTSQAATTADSKAQAAASTSATQSPAQPVPATSEPARQPVQPDANPQPQIANAVSHATHSDAAAGLTQNAAQPETTTPAPTVTADVQVSAQHHTASDTPTAFDKLGISIAAKSAEGLHQFDIRLDPVELGRVQVQLTVDNAGQAQANLVVDNPKTLELLQRDAASLNRALTDAGLNLSGSGLNFSLREQQQQQNGGGSQKSRGRGLSVSAAASATASAARSASGSYAPNSVRLDIRV